MSTSSTSSSQSSFSRSSDSSSSTISSLSSLSSLSTISSSSISNSSLSSQSSSSLDSSSSSTSSISSLSSKSSWSSRSFSSKSSESHSSKSSESSTSSSSSSFHYSFSRTLPFTIEQDNINPVNCLAYDGTYIYAGMGEGKVIRSIDGMIWDTYLVCDDLYITSLYVVNTTLYTGTSPKGNIYITDLTVNTTILSQSIGSEISSFISYQDNMYAFTSDPAEAYKYNKNLLEWELIYSFYPTKVYKTIIVDGEVVILTNSNNIIRFNGVDFYLQEIMEGDTDLTSSSSSSSSLTA